MPIKSFLLLLSFFAAFFTVQGRPNYPTGNCSTPTGLSAVTAANAADLSWNAVPGAVGYWVEVEGEGSTPAYHIEIQIASNSYTATGLTANGNYKFKVRTKCATDKSDWSEWYNFSSGSGGGNGGSGGSCAIPAGLTVSVIAGSAATLSWAPVSGATGYWIEVESEGQTPLFHVEIQVNVNTYIVSGLAANGLYKFKVRSVCGGGQSDWSSWMFFSAAGSGNGSGTCTAPSTIMISNPTGISAAINWNAVAGAIAYNIEVEDASGNQTSFKDTATVTTTTYTVNNLLPGLQYKVKVRTVCSNGSKSDWSNWVTFNSSTGQITPTSNSGSCGKPKFLVVSNLTNSTALLSWKKMPGVLHYSVRLEKESGGSQHISFSTTDTFVLVTGLVPGSLYKFKVRSHCSGGHSKWSSWKFFATPLMVIPGTGNKSLHQQPLITTPATASLISYPNPVSGMLVVNLDNAAEGQVNHFSFTDLSGRVVLDQFIKSDTGFLSQVFDLSGFNNGIYLLRWTNGQQSVTKKIIVSK